MLGDVLQLLRTSALLHPHQPGLGGMGRQGYVSNGAAIDGAKLLLGTA